MKSPVPIVPRVSSSLWREIRLLGRLIPLFALSSGTYAQTSAQLGDASLEELLNIPVNTVVGASKFEQKVTRAPASVSVITADEIKKFGYRTLAEALESAPGLYVTSDRNYSFLGFRGFSQPGDFNTGVLLLMDGHRINDPTYNLMYIGADAIADIDDVSRIEVIRGPSSSIYGNSAFLGVINLIPRRGSDVNGLEVSGGTGTFGTYKARATYGKKFGNGADVIVSGSYYTSSGQQDLFFPEYADAAHNNGHVLDSDSESAAHWYSRVAVGDFTFSAAYSDRTKHVPTAPYESGFNSGQAQTTDRRGYLDIRYAHEFSGDLGVTGSVSYDWYPYLASWPYDDSTAVSGFSLNRDESLGEWVRAQLQVTQLWLERHHLIAGFEYQQNLRLYQTNYDESPYVNYLNLDGRSANFGLYAQGEFALLDQVLVNAGIRYDHFDAFGGTFDPRVALIYSPKPKTTFKAIYGEAFRAPNEYELNFESLTYRSNADLGAETIRTYELVFEQYLPPNLRFSASMYHYDLRGLITQVTDTSGLFYFANTASVEANGVEVELEGRSRQGVQIRGSASLQKAEDVGAGEALSNSPRYLAQLRATWPLLSERLFGSLEMKWRGAVTSVARENVPGYYVVNGTLLCQQLRPGLELSASIYNIFDAHYRTPSSGNLLQDTLEQNGRTYRLSLTAKF